VCRLLEKEFLGAAQTNRGSLCECVRLNPSIGTFVIVTMGSRLRLGPMAYPSESEWEWGIAGQQQIIL